MVTMYSAYKNTRKFPLFIRLSVGYLFKFRSGSLVCVDNDFMTYSKHHDRIDLVITIVSYIYILFVRLFVKDVKSIVLMSSCPRLIRPGQIYPCIKGMFVLHFKSSTIFKTQSLVSKSDIARVPIQTTKRVYILL